MKIRLVLLTLLSVAVLNCKSPNLDVDQATSLSDEKSGLPSTNRSIPETDASLLAYYDFEKDLGSWYEKNMCCPWSIALSQDVKRSGKSSMRVELKKGDMTNGARAELGEQPGNNKEGWFGFSMFFPSSFTQESVEECITQWQAKPDFALGEQWRSPPMMLGILNDRFVLEIRSDPNEVTVQGKFSFTRIDLGPVDKETWHDWVFHIKWAFDDTGIVEVWRNGKLVLSRVNQPNSYNDILSPYFKIGIYKWDWANPSVKSFSESRVMYVDEVTIGNENAVFEKVSPEALNGALPVKLASFLARKNGNSSQLSWTTTEEANTAKFVIERSLNARDWKSIGAKSAAGNSATVLNYVFMDSAPARATNYYRLKMIDNDGTFAYSSIKNVNF